MSNRPSWPVAYALRRTRLSWLELRALADPRVQASAVGAEAESEALRLYAGLAADPTPISMHRSLRVVMVAMRRIFRVFEVDEAGIEALRAAARRGPLLLVPAHRSHADYLLILKLLIERDLAPPTVAAGQNLAFFPLSWIMRTGNAFFLRRKQKLEGLYGAVLSAYLTQLFQQGQSVKIYLEGGRTRTGRVGEARLGLLSVAADAAVSGAAPGLRMVPMSVGYERVLEAGAVTAELEGRQKRPERLHSLVAAASLLWRRDDHGYVNFQIGEPADRWTPPPASSAPRRCWRARACSPSRARARADGRGPSPRAGSCCATTPTWPRGRWADPGRGRPTERNRRSTAIRAGLPAVPTGRRPGRRTRRCGRFASCSAGGGLATEQVVPGQVRTADPKGLGLIAAGGRGPKGEHSAASPAQQAAISQNPHLQLTHEADVPVLTPEETLAGYMPGVIWYPPGDTVIARLDAFFAWYDATRGTLDPVAFAALAQKQLVSIHPFGDGNGRVTRLVMDPALVTQGLPPALVADPNLDLLTLDAQWIEEVRAGVLETWHLAVSHADGYNAAIQQGDAATAAALRGILLGMTGGSDLMTDTSTEGDHVR